jgi:hypothetical protein
MASDPLTEALRSVFAPIVKQSANWPPILAYGVPAMVAVLLIIALGLVVPTGLIWLMAIVILAPLAGYIIVARSARHNSAVDASLPQRPNATIAFPKDGSPVNKGIYCTGFATGVNSVAGLWLAIEANGFIWPKERNVVVRDGEWKHTIFEHGATRTFSILLLAADDQGDKFIRDWLNSGRIKGEYAELRGVPGTETLARVDDVEFQ